MTVTNKAIFPSVTPPACGPSTKPWRVRDRDQLLLWFETADLETADGLLALRQFTSVRGRRRATSREGWISQEAGARWPLPAGDAEAINFCRGLRAELLGAKAEFHRVHKARPSKRDVLELSGYLDLLGQTLMDVNLDFERHLDVRKRNLVVWPLAQGLQSRSLAGELALARWLELLNAVGSFVCPVCTRVELVTAGRAWPRKVCRDPYCERRWRREHKPKEDPAKVAARMRKWRAGGNKS